MVALKNFFYIMLSFEDDNRVYLVDRRGRTTIRMDAPPPNDRQDKRTAHRDPRDKNCRNL